MFNYLRPCELQHTRFPCPSLSPRVCSNSSPLSQWCHPTSSSSVAPFSSCLHSFPASESFPVSPFFATGNQVLELQLQYQFLQWIFRVIDSPQSLSVLLLLSPHVAVLHSALLCFVLCTRSRVCGCCLQESLLVRSLSETIFEPYFFRWLVVWSGRSRIPAFACFPIYIIK